MASSVWLIVVLPAVISFLFGLWVMVNVLDDFANRNQITSDQLQGSIQGGAPPGAQ